MEEMKKILMALSAVSILCILYGCSFFTSAYDNLMYANISPYLTDIQELPGTGFTAAEVGGYLYVLGEEEGSPVLFRTVEEEWSWESFSIADSVFDLDAVWDGEDYTGSEFSYAFENAAGEIVFLDMNYSGIILFDGTTVHSGDIYSTFSFAYGGIDYTVTAGTGSITVGGSNLEADSGYTFGDYSPIVGADESSLYLLSWFGTAYTPYETDYSELKLLILPLDSIAAWGTLSYPYGGEEVLPESHIGMKGVDSLSVGLNRIWMRGWDNSYFFSTEGELLIDASTAGIDQNSAFSKTTGKLYSVYGSEVYEFTIP